MYKMMSVQRFQGAKFILYFNPKSRHRNIYL